MAASFEFPLQFRRQYEGPLDEFTEFTTTALRTSFLTDPRRYAGMIVIDKQDGKTYSLSNNRAEWREVPVSSNNTEIRLTFGQLSVDNISLDSNTISNSTGDLILSPTSNVGIGTTQPGDRLTINGNLSANGTIKLSEGTTSAKGIQFHTDVFLYRSANNTLRLDDNFNIAFNGGKTTLSLSDTNANVGITIGGDVNIYRSTSNVLKTDDELEIGILNTSTSNSVIVETNGKLQKRTLNANSFDTTATFLTGSPTINNILRLTSLNTVGNANIFQDTGNNIGISTTTPNERLTVNGNLSANGQLGVTNNVTVSGKVFVKTLDTDTTSNSVVVDVSSELEKRTINSRVWDTNATFLSAASTAPTTNRILRLTSLNTIGDSNIFQDTNSRIGIGTSTPSTNHLLTVIGGITGTNLDIDNIDIDGNTISSTNTTGDLILNTNGGNLVLNTNGSGVVTLRSQRFPAIIGSNNQILTVTNNASNQLGWVTQSYFTILTASEAPVLLPSTVGSSMSGLDLDRSYFRNLLPNKIYRCSVFLREDTGTLTTARMVLSGNRVFSVMPTDATALQQNITIVDLTNGYPFSRNFYIFTNETTDLVVGVSGLDTSTFVGVFNPATTLSYELLN